MTRHVEVYGLLHMEVRHYVGISPREAVIAAYAQSIGDYNTWEYEHRYGHLAKEYREIVECGVDTNVWSAFA